jgi:hypothetical protein
LVFTEAAGTGAPEASVTIPVMLAATWARAGVQHASAKNATTANRHSKPLIAIAQ